MSSPQKFLSLLLFHLRAFKLYAQAHALYLQKDYAYGTKNATAEPVAVKAHTRKPQSGNVLDIVSEGTSTEVVEYRFSEEARTCDICGAMMEEMGKEVRWSLEIESAWF